MQAGEATFSDSDPEPEEKDEEIQRVKIRFSVFFDGTLNNRANVEAREKKKFSSRLHWLSGSYKNDRSNVAKMERFVDAENAEGFDFPFKSYIEGIGTTDERGDSIIGASLGTGTTGVKQKVRKGLNDVVRQIQGEAKLYGVIVDELVFDVFGFSRGAAAARYFVHQVFNDKVVGRGRNRRISRPMARRRGIEYRKRQRQVQLRRLV